MDRNNSLRTLTLIGAIVVLALELGLIVGGVFVAWHFIAKWW